MTIEIGDPAPAFKLPTADGGVLSNDAHGGRSLVLFFYPKDNTSGCTVEAQDFTRLRGAFEAAGATVAGISVGDVKSKVAFARKQALDVALAADEDNAVADAFGVWQEKSMYGRRYMGIERSTFLIGPDGRIAEIWRKVSVPGHAEAVLAAVRKRSGG